METIPLRPLQNTTYNTLLEIFWTVAPCGILLSISYPSFSLVSQASEWPVSSLLAVAFACAIGAFEGSLTKTPIFPFGASPSKFATERRKKMVPAVQSGAIKVCRFISAFFRLKTSRANASFHFGKKYGTNSFSTGDVFIKVIAKATHRTLIA